MRPPHTLGTALGALALVLTLPASAHAVDGNLHYKYGDPQSPSHGQLNDPTANRCYNTTELDGHPETAFGPYNQTGAYLAVYSEEDCQGTKVILKPATESGDLVTFKSLVYAPEE
ncbi:hypothetical protein [Streptomyces sp. NPDC050504]|uniref:hypothetical protein n=1 Tax=Streptomyces sp. NPDC050504 TaxID=3365618 RepID=UPI0037B0E94D